MTETIKLMKAHTSVRRFKEQEIPQADLDEILTAGQMASSWKNFQHQNLRKDRGLFGYLGKSQQRHRVSQKSASVLDHPGQSEPISLS